MTKKLIIILIILTSYSFADEKIDKDIYINSENIFYNKKLSLIELGKDSYVNYQSGSINTDSGVINTEKKTILINDDAAVINSSYTEGRRGVAGTVIVEKVVGSLAEDGGDLESCHRLGEKVNRNCSSIGVALTSCTIPAAGKTTFDISESDIEFGVGIHGEPGRKREKIRNADSIVEDMLQVIYKDFEDKNLALNASSEVLLLINGFNSTPLSELYLLFNASKKLLNNKQIPIARSLVGNYTTALDMAGASITICLLDDEIKKHWDTEVLTPNLRWGI